MNKRWIFLATTTGLAFACAFCMQSGAVETGSSTIQVTPSKRLNDISPLLFGAAIEWADNGNGLYDEKSDGLRQDILDALKPLRLSVLRFPGGFYPTTITGATESDHDPIDHLACTRWRNRTRRITLERMNLSKCVSNLARSL